MISLTHSPSILPSFAVHRAKIIIQVNRHIVKKNRRPIHGRGTNKWIGKSEELRTAEQQLTLEMMSYKNQNNLEMLKGDLHISFVFYMSNYFNKDGTRNRNMADLSNLIELPQDCLQYAGIIENDTDVISLDGSRRIHAIENKLEINIWQFICQ